MTTLYVNEAPMTQDEITDTQIDLQAMPDQYLTQRMAYLMSRLRELDTQDRIAGGAEHPDLTLYRLMDHERMRRGLTWPNPEVEQVIGWPGVMSTAQRWQTRPATPQPMPELQLGPNRSQVRTDPEQAVTEALTVERKTRLAGAAIGAASGALIAKSVEGNKGAAMVVGAAAGYLFSRVDGAYRSFVRSFFE